MTFADALGWAASLMTLVTFVQKRMVPLRVAAILANLFFIGYGALGHYLPVLALHLMLLPVNGQRLYSHLVGRCSRGTAPVAIEMPLSGHERTAGPRRGIHRLVSAAVNGGVPRAFHHLIETRIGFGGWR